MLETPMRGFPGHSTEALLDAAAKAAESLGHEVDHVDREPAQVHIRTGKTEITKAGKEILVRETEVQGSPFVMVSGGFFGGKKTIAFGMALFKAMDVILAS